jgi:hypothetical protein
MTSYDYYYCVACGMHMISTSPNSCDEPSDIIRPLLLPSTVAMDYMTSDDYYDYWARGTRVVATSPHSSDGCSDNSGLSLLAPTVAMDKRSISTRLPVALGYLISMVRRYWTVQ